MTFLQTSSNVYGGAPVKFPRIDILPTPNAKLLIKTSFYGTVQYLAKSLILLHWIC
jgi:hypothetical protein